MSQVLDSQQLAIGGLLVLRSMAHASPDGSSTSTADFARDSKVMIGRDRVFRRLLNRRHHPPRDTSVPCLTVTLVLPPHHGTYLFAFIDPLFAYTSVLPSEPTIHTEQHPNESKSRTTRHTLPEKRLTRGTRPTFLEFLTRNRQSRSTKSTRPPKQILPSD